MSWDAILFGRPAVWLAVASLIAFCGGLILRRPWLGAFGAVLSMPYCLLLAQSVVLIGVPVAVCNVQAARMIRQRRLWPALALLLPLVAFLTIAQFGFK